MDILVILPHGHARTVYESQAGPGDEAFRGEGMCWPGSQYPHLAR
ncbi:MAG: hypothetical protein QOJ73_1186 [Streptosporangiaceae bacterium]|jgi:hypothetical protein|nr:hypothetical protein [Streptosporangiaceae bacterium]